MAVDKNRMTKGKKEPKELYLKIPYHILNIPGLGLCEKVLLAHIYSFGEKGCWQSNATLAEIFMVCPRTISLWVAKLAVSNLIQAKSPKGYYRTIWAKSHPKVSEASVLWYRKQQVPNPNKETAVHRAKSCAQDSNNLRSQCAKSGNRLSKILRTTNNKTIRETISQTTAPPAPLPARGQASAVLTERKRATVRSIDEFKKRFGIGKRSHPPLSGKEIQDRRQTQLKALQATAMPK
jgi:hypothetical protein